MMRGMNMQKMMKQAQKMAMEFVGQAPDEMVTATLTGDKKLKDLKINPEAVDPDDVDMLSDLIVAAVNDGLDKVEQATQAKMGKYTRGLGM